MFINAAFIIAEKGAGHPVHDHEAVAAFFQVFIVESFSRLAEMPGKVIGLLIIDQHHQAFTTVAAIGTADPGRNGFIQHKYEFVDLLTVSFFQKYLKAVILSGMRF